MKIKHSTGRFKEGVLTPPSGSDGSIVFQKNGRIRIKSDKKSGKRRKDVILAVK